MSEKPVYLLPGGPSSDRDQMTLDIRTALEACGQDPRVAYVGTASADNEMFFSYIKESLTAAGARKVTLAPIAGQHADIAEAKRILSEADAIFLSGGDVEDGMAWLGKAHLIAFLTSLYKAGKVFLGTSAGAIMMGQHWVHWDVQGDDTTSKLFPCLSFVPMDFDTHGENEDWSDLRCLVRLLDSGTQGYGLSSGGFYRADSEGRLTSFRNGPVIFRNDGGAVRGPVGD